MINACLTEAGILTTDGLIIEPWPIRVQLNRPWGGQFGRLVQIIPVWQKVKNVIFILHIKYEFKSKKMVTLTQEMKDMIATQQCFIGTSDANGMPNVAPKRSTRVLSDDSLIFTEGTGGITYANIKRGSKVAVAVVNREILDGYRFIGIPELHETGELYEKAVAMSAKMGMPKPIAVVVIHVTEIHSLKPGPMAGKKIG